MKSNSNAGIEHDFIDQFGRIHIDCKPLPTPPLPPRPVHSSRTSVDRIHKPRQSEPAILRPQISFPGPTFRGSPIRHQQFTPQRQLRANPRHSEGSLNAAAAVASNAHAPPSSPSKNGFATSPSDAPHKEQCRGITKQAKRCTRRVKAQNIETLPRFCHQHSKDILAQKGFFNERGVWISFDDWIPRHLSSSIQIQLRLLMEKPTSPTDAPGYIYVYSIRDSESATHAEYKVGRTNNINRRIDNWSKQCNKELILRQYFPTSPVSSSSRLHTTFAVADPNLKCQHVNRLERLIHLELAEYSAYSTTEIQKCTECGSKHKEIFKLRKMRTSNGTEFETVIRPMIDKWNALVCRL